MNRPGRYGLESIGLQFARLHHETRLKASLLEQVKTARDGGASFDELAALIAKLETAPSEV